jgi:hypothetical protein
MAYETYEVMEKTHSLKEIAEDTSRQTLLNLSSRFVDLGSPMAPRLEDTKGRNHGETCLEALEKLGEFLNAKGE